MAAGRGSSRPSDASPAQRLRPVATATLVVLAAYAGLQLVAGSTMSSTLWWQNEWSRLRLQHKYPTASFTQPVPGPTWQGWVPAATTSFVLILALVLLGLALVSAGRGWWLLLVAAVPLGPTQIAPGSWAPALSNQVMYAVVWPAGATAPSTSWAWISAAIEAVVIAVPAMVLRSVVLDRRPRVRTSDVVRRLLPAAVVVGLVAVWNDNAGDPQDWGALGRRAIFVAVGALLVSGSMRRRWALPFFTCLPAIAAGLVRWTIDLDGRPVVVTDPTAAALTVAFCCGAVWVFVQPAMARAYHRVRRYWTEMVADEAKRQNARQDAWLAAGAVVAGQVEDAESDSVSELVSGVGRNLGTPPRRKRTPRRTPPVSRPSHAGLAASGGRHRQ